MLHFVYGYASKKSFLKMNIVSRVNSIELYSRIENESAKYIYDYNELQGFSNFLGGETLGIRNFLPYLSMFLTEPQCRFVTRVSSSNDEMSHRSTTTHL